MSFSSNRYKQRKRLYNASWSSAIKLMSVPLSKDLKARLKIKSIPVRANDTVKIVSGGFKGRSGKVARTDVKRRLVYVEGITGKAQKGKTKLVGIHVSNLLLTRLDLSDKYRKLILQRKGVSPELLEKEPEFGVVEAPGAGEPDTESVKSEATSSGETVAKTEAVGGKPTEEKKEPEGGS